MRSLDNMFQHQTTHRYPQECYPPQGTPEQCLQIHSLSGLPEFSNCERPHRWGVVAWRPVNRFLSDSLNAQTWKCGLVCCRYIACSVGSGHTARITFTLRARQSRHHCGLPPLCQTTSNRTPEGRRLSRRQSTSAHPTWPSKQLRPPGRSRRSFGRGCASCL